MQLPKTVETSDGLSVEGASAELLELLLPEFEFELARAGVPVEECFAPGTDLNAVADEFDHLGLPVSDELAAWFAWHDGVTDLGMWAKVFPRFQFYSIDIVVHEHTNENGRPHGYEYDEWNPNWVQLLGDHNGLALECIEPHNRSPRVRPLNHAGEFGTQPSNGRFQVVSLCTLVTWWIESLRNDEYAWYPVQRAWNWDFGKQYDRLEKRFYI